MKQLEASTVCAYYPYFKTRFSLILSKTVKLEVDLASVNMEVIDLYEAARGKHIVDGLTRLDEASMLWL
jgi:hypothetical protein